MASYNNKMLRLQQVMYLSLAEENFEQDCQVERVEALTELSL